MRGTSSYRGAENLEAFVLPSLAGGIQRRCLAGAGLAGHHRHRVPQSVNRRTIDRCSGERYGLARSARSTPS